MTRQEEIPVATIALGMACATILFLNARWFLMIVSLPANEQILKIAVPAIALSCFLLLIVVRGNVRETITATALRMKLTGKQEIDVCELLGLSSWSISQNRLIELHRRRKVRIVCILSLTGHPTIPSRAQTTTKTLYLYESLFTRLTDLFLALRAQGMQLAYLTSLLPLEVGKWVTDQRIKSLEEDLSKMDETTMIPERTETLLEIERLQECKRGHCYKGAVLVAIWVDTDEEKVQQGRQEVQRLAESLMLSLDTVFPEMEVVQLQGISLMKAISGFLFPQERSQTGTI